MTNKKLQLAFTAILCAMLLFSCAPTGKGEQFKVLQINTWQETTTVPGGFQALVDVILQTAPDVVLLCEIRNYNDQPFISRVLKELSDKGETYYGENAGHSSAILSRYPLTGTSVPFTLENGSSPMIKSSFTLNGRQVVCYSAHLDYTHYECYLPRGYSGTSWQKLDAPVLDADSILMLNRISYRDEAIEAFLSDARGEVSKGNIVLLGGDFNEPSHLDWQADTRNLWDHNGVVINWDCSVMLQKAGYKDSFREKFPSAVTHPGFTFPSANEAVPISKLAWAPAADERDRIDFIYYYPDAGLSLESVSLVGPSQTILRGVQIENDASDTFIEPIGVWPTDHKANLAVFNIR